MDGHRFDDMARGLATGMGRRGLVRAALGGVLAAFAATGQVQAQNDDRRRRRQRDENRRRCPDGCPDGQRCVDGECRDAACREDDECVSGADACVGGRCVDGRCTQQAVRCQTGYLCCGNGECCPQPCATDIDCYVVDPCRVGRCEEGVCSFETKDPCAICEADEDCNDLENEAFCCNGVCTRPCPAGTVMNKGCECVLESLDDLDATGVSDSDDASGSDGGEPAATDDAPADEPPEGETESADDGSITLGGPITITTSDAPESTIITTEPAADEPVAEPAPEPAPDESAAPPEGESGAAEGEPVPAG